MNIKIHRSCLLCFSFLALLVCAAHAQETGEGAGDRLSKLRTDEQNMEQTSAKLQEDLRHVESVDDANRPQYVVIMAGAHLLEGYALMPIEKYESRIAAMVRLGEMTPQQAQQHKRDILAKTRTFPQEAGKILITIGQKLAATKRELRSLSVGSGEVANITDSPGDPTSRTNSDASNNLSGTWTADDGGTYLITQTGNRVVWEGTSGDGGRTWAHRFEGMIQGDSIVGRWTYLPTMSISGGGPLTVRIASGSKLEKVSSSEDFGGTVWTKTDPGVTPSGTVPAENSYEVENSRDEPSGGRVARGGCSDLSGKWVTKNSDGGLTWDFSKVNDSASRYNVRESSVGRAKGVAELLDGNMLRFEFEVSTETGERYSSVLKCRLDESCQSSVSRCELSAYHNGRLGGVFEATIERLQE